MIIASVAQRQLALAEVRVDVGTPPAASPTKIALVGVSCAEIISSVQKCTEGICDLCIEERFMKSSTVQRFLVFRCPTTDMKVQASFVWKDGDEAERRFELYETVNCPACASTHFFNLRTGRLLRE